MAAQKPRLRTLLAQLTCVRSGHLGTSQCPAATTASSRSWTAGSRVSTWRWMHFRLDGIRRIGTGPRPNARPSLLSPSRPPLADKPPRDPPDLDIAVQLADGDVDELPIKLFWHPNE
jgi:hypothetical protein